MATFAALDTITTSIVDAALRGDALTSDALTYLLRRYRADDRAELSDAIGVGLAHALARFGDDSGTLARAGWLRVFAGAATISEDDRLTVAARSLIASLADEWADAVLVDETSASIDACMAAAHLADPQALIPTAVDALERIVGGSYRPGVGVAHVANASTHARGGLADQVRAASALLTAFEITGRLPYSMLAEELMQLSRRDVDDERDVELTCEASRVLCRLIALHDDESYRRAAVIAADADYRVDAERLLERARTVVAPGGLAAALYGIALDEWSALPRAGAKAP